MATPELPPPISHLTAARLALFVDGELSRVENRTVVRHLLTGCRSCVAIARAAWSGAGSLLRDRAGAGRSPELAEVFDLGVDSLDGIGLREI